jgi:hypothetical protein
MGTVSRVGLGSVDQGPPLVSWEMAWEMAGPVPYVVLGVGILVLLVASR